MMLKTYREHKGPFVDRKAPRALAQRLIDELEIVTPGVGTPVRRLSGGNVQKVLVGREIDSTPTVLMTAYPVRGLDINSSYTIYGLLNQQKMKGVAVLPVRSAKGFAMCVAIAPYFGATWLVIILKNVSRSAVVRASV